MQGNIVRRGAINVLVSSLDNQEMAVLHARMEVYTLVAEVFLLVFHQNIGFFRSDMTG